jgi:hypothetical protein
MGKRERNAHRGKEQKYRKWDNERKVGRRNRNKSKR